MKHFLLVILMSMASLVPQLLWAGANRGNRLIGQSGDHHFSILLSDALQAGGGDAFDRSLTDVGVNSGGSNLVFATINPFVVAGDMDYLPDPSLYSVSIAITNAAASRQSLSLTGAHNAYGYDVMGAILYTDSSAQVDFQPNPLGVYVFPNPPLSRTVSLHCVDDTQGNLCGLQPSDLNTILQGINAIWAQVGISFSLVVIDTITVSFLTAPMPISSNPINQYQIQLGNTATADYDIFVVNSFADGTSSNTTDGVTPIGSACDGTDNTAHNYSIVRRNGNGGPYTLSYISTVAAHELGHAMGLNASTMYQGLDLQVHENTGYLLMDSAPVGTTVTPLQRDCISAIRNWGDQ